MGWGHSLFTLPPCINQQARLCNSNKLRILVAQEQFHFMLMTPVHCELTVILRSQNGEGMKILSQALSAQTLREAALHSGNGLMEEKAVVSMMGPCNLDSPRKAKIFLEDNGLFFVTHRHDDSLGLRFSTIQLSWGGSLDLRLNHGLFH